MRSDRSIINITLINCTNLTVLIVICQQVQKDHHSLIYCVNGYGYCVWRDVIYLKQHTVHWMNGLMHQHNCFTPFWHGAKQLCHASTQLFYAILTRCKTMKSMHGKHQRAMSSNESIMDTVQIMIGIIAHVTRWGRSFSVQYAVSGISHHVIHSTHNH